MTGLLDIDGTRAIEELMYATRSREPRWVRLIVAFADGGGLVCTTREHDRLP
ncbi:hypothetical protein [Rhabdothermincola sediminis]|uniref:hypothetical protein n=1 Tax=Rhabdothermincola sediminis TaxID=2751370 RepID=UPI001AA09A5C|nr:hypothetical protein [Rhabdothermincola sediminis]